MLLIRCPYCRMDRPESEFRYGGEAHITRPAEPSAMSDAEWADFLELEVHPVIEDDAAGAAAKKVYGK